METIEAEQPIRIEEYGLLADTEGAGRYRGGLGMVRTYRFLSDDTVVQVRADREKTAPYGLNGGLASTTTKVTVTKDGETVPMPGKFLDSLGNNDSLRIAWPGAGGWGDPMEREPQAVLADVIAEKVSVERAQAVYGVVVDATRRTIDFECTRRLRARAHRHNRHIEVMSEDIRLGVDVGGTFTDVVLLKSNGVAISKKTLSSPPNFGAAIKQSILELLRENRVTASQIAEYTHGATVATNAIITRQGAATGLITTLGFRDVLEIRRMRLHKLYDIQWERPEPLVPRHLRLEVAGRMDHNGVEITPLDEAAVKQAVRRLVDENVTSIAICFINAYANNTHEKRARELVLEIDPAMHVSNSSDVLPEIREYERTSSTVINAYVHPIVDTYFRSMETDNKTLGLDIPIMVMQSNGGMIPSEIARQVPIHIIESGPAAGVTGAHRLAKRMGVENVITLDMGGTTAKGALIEDGKISRSPEYEVGGELSIGHRLMKGSGYLLRVPSIDIAEVGAGGGSVAWVDAGGALRVGPHSAGASPGPACYNLGGEAPTITDANVHLGLTNPDHLAGGALKLHASLADKAIHDKIAAPLNLDVTTAAWGIRTVANSSLIRTLRAVSTEQGRDPRRFTLLAFGGMGPIHAPGLAEELGITKVVIPPLPGLFSAVGLLFADVEHHLVQTRYTDVDTLDYQAFHDLTGKLINEGATMLEREGYAAGYQDLSLFADTR